MKKKILLLVDLILIISIVTMMISGCAANSENLSTSNKSEELVINNYKDIPGITEEEIAAIEAFKNEGRTFRYGSLLTTEMFPTHDGTYAGFTPKFCKLLSEIFEIPFQTEELEWEELMKGLNSKKYDFTGELTPTPERELIYKMSHPIVERGLLAFSLSESPMIETEEDINGMTIGFLEDTITAQSIRDYYPSLNFNEVDVSDTQDAIEKLQAGIIDAFVDEAASAVVFTDPDFNRSKEIFSMVYTPIALVTANPELEPIISVVDKYILANGINKIHELYIEGNKEYNGYAFNSSLTTEEADYLANLEDSGVKVPVALENELYPISFYNKQSKEYQGIAVDVLEEVRALTGIEFETVTNAKTSWPDMLNMLETGEASLISELLHNDERENEFLFSESPYATCRYALLSKMDHPNLETYQVSYAKIGVVEGTGPTSVFETYFPRHPNVEYYQYHSDAYAALEKGTIDLLMASEYQLLDFINYHEKPGYKINRYINLPLYESYFGFNLNETQLHSIFNKAMKHIDVDFLEKSWISRSYDYEKALATEREQVAIQRLYTTGAFAIILLIAVLTLLAFVIRDMRKRKIIENQTSVIDAIYYSFPDIVFTKDLNGKYTSANRSALLFAKKDKEEFLGKTSPELFTDDKNMAAQFAASDEIVLRENRVTKTEIWREYSDGSRRLFEDIKTPLVNKGETIGLLGFMRDITEHNELLEKVKYQSQYELVRYSLTSNAMKIVHFDMEIPHDNKIPPEHKVLWSDDFRQMLGFDNKDEFPDVIGSASSRLHPEDRKRVLDTFFTHLNDYTGETICDFECRIMVKDGTYRYFRIAVGTLRDENGIPIRMAGAMEDITEKKLIQQKLDEANRVNAKALHTLESILNGFDGMFYVTVPDTGELLFVNGRMKEHFNLDDDCIGQYCYKVFQQNKDERCEYCPCYELDKEPDGTITWEEKNPITNRSYRKSDRYILWPDGRTVHLQYSVDMTDLIEAKEIAEEQRLFVIEEHKRLQSILDMLPIGVRIIRTSDGMLLYANAAAVEIFKGESFETQAFGQSSNMFLPEFQPDGRKSVDVFNEYIRDQATSIEIQCLRINGEPFTARFTTCRINYQGELCSLGVVEDVTAEKEHQQRLRDIAKKEQEANQAKSDFLAKMSHEIRTPMNAIIGMSELALRERMTTAAYEHIFTVKQAGVHLLSLINEILDFSKIETGKMEIVPHEYALSSLANDVISVIRMRLFDTQIRFAVNIDSNIPDSLIGDVMRIRQVLINILGNAVKYTDKGFVCFDVSAEAIDDDNLMLKMQISDSGRGIKDEDITNLFGEYIQMDVENNQGIEGVGLGLAISWHLIKAMGGQILVESEYGKGSTFTVELPQEISNHAQIATVENKEQKRVIICERRKLVADSIEKSLENLGVHYVAAANISELCEKLAETPYEFVFIAHKFFDTESDRILRVAKGSKIVLLAEFGEVIPEGSWSVLVMPAHSITISNILNGFDEEYSYSVNEESLSQFSAPVARVLIVDDINTNLIVAEGLMRPYDMNVDLCKSGEEAIEAIKKNEYDLVFMDHRMPGIDGIEATKRIRELGDEDSRFKTLPIIALTANAVSGTREMFLANGFNDYLSKPIETNKLNIILEKWIKSTLKIRKTETADETQEGGTYLKNIDGLDTEKGLLHSGGEPELFLEILELYCDDGYKKAKLIQDCLDTEDIKTYTVHVHAMKSASANVGAEKISEAAKMLEMAGVNGDMDYINANTEVFLRDLEELIGRIKGGLLSQKKETEIEDDSFISDLLSLKSALENMDAFSIKIFTDKIKKGAPQKYSEDVKVISRNILLSEYDEAVSLIEIILQNEE